MELKKIFFSSNFSFNFFFLHQNLHHRFWHIFIFFSLSLRLCTTGPNVLNGMRQMFCTFTRKQEDFFARISSTKDSQKTSFFLLLGFYNYEPLVAILKERKDMQVNVNCRDYIFCVKTLQRFSQRRSQKTVTFFVTFFVNFDLKVSSLYFAKFLKVCLDSQFFLLIHVQSKLVWSHGFYDFLEFCVNF